LFLLLLVVAVGDDDGLMVGFDSQIVLHKSKIGEPNEGILCADRYGKRCSVGYL